MTLPEAITNILLAAAKPLTPQEIREAIKNKYPQFYGTPSQKRNVENLHYKNIDHALLAHIYSAIRNQKNFFCDNNSKPIKVSLQTGEVVHRFDRVGVVQKREWRSSIVSPEKLREKIPDLLINCEKYHNAYYKAEPFQGPSLYFHQRAIETHHLPGSLAHSEYVYATLASWGMHRMSKRGSKMKNFDTFHHSIEALENKLIEAQTFDFREMNDRKWTLLRDIFQSITVMASGTSIVGNSKAMHHILPNIVPPIDREYTLWYLLGNKNIKNDLDSEWTLMKDIISGFFIPVASNRDFEMTASRWIARKDQYPWDTSLMKIVDNLIIGSKKVIR
ncbi:MAG: hypothetical protein ABSC54_01245 [Smithellaceae bacterium]|jgi:hypothetical protein